MTKKLGSNTTTSSVPLNSTTYQVNENLPCIPSNISKIYHNDDKKYVEWNDSLDYKIENFKEICNINQSSVDCRINGLSLALKEPALSEFRAHRHDSGMTFDGMIRHFGACYEGMDFKHSEIQAWNAISYKMIRDQNTSKLPF
ncbi:hypothetical protein Golomagni_02279 [Golovinomyces magnicellulatus]|nr:hypothetical protein Golomagni_02279 [Golovinomyces magnicellulatus]